ncbi:MAG: NosD domain-containing protein, partial [Candidatus Thermoplasmatota archaeon]
IIVPVNITELISINLTKGITNPTTVGGYHLNVNTSQESTSVNSQDYTIFALLNWNTTEFVESSENDGSIETVVNLTLVGDTFKVNNSVMTLNTHYSVSHVPSGLTVVVTGTSSTTATIELTGNAVSHYASDSINDLEITFLDDAFTGDDASSVVDSSKNDLKVTFIGPVINTNTSEDFDTIQAAIDDGDTEDGHVIIVFPGNYTENVNVTKSLFIISPYVNMSGIEPGAELPVIDGDGDVFAVKISAPDVVIAGFEIKNADVGIYCANVGFWIAFNKIHDVDTGIDFSVSNVGYEMENESLVVNPMFIYRNNITAESYGVYFNLQKWGYKMDNSSCVIGGFFILNNTINVTGIDAYGIYLYLKEFGYDMHNGSVFVLGGIYTVGNNITSSKYGIYTKEFSYFGNNMYEGSFSAIGDILFNDNIIESTDDSLYIEYIGDFGEYIYGNSWFTMGDIEVNNNNITSGDIGIYAEYENFGYKMYDDSLFSMGNITFNENSIISNGEGIYLDYFYYFGYQMYNNSLFTMGDLTVNENTITTDEYGIRVSQIDDFGSYIGYSGSEGDPTTDVHVTVGDITFNGNAISSSDDGIYIGYINDFGYYMYGSSSFTMGNINLNGNTITTDEYGIYVNQIDDFGAYLGEDQNSTVVVTIGNITFNGNTIISDKDGVYIGYIDYFGYYMYGSSSFTMGNLTFNGNSINSDNGYGIDISSDDEAGIYYFGYEMHNSSCFTMGDIQFNDNTIESMDDGIYVYYISGFGNNLGKEEEDNISFVMGDITFNGNVIDSYQNGNGEGYGINVYWVEYFGYKLYGTSSFNMKNILLNDNDIVSINDGIYIYLQYFGNDMDENTSFTMQDIIIHGNTIKSNNSDGIYVDYIYEFGDDDALFTMGDILITENIIYECGGYGLYIDEEVELPIMIYHNDFINNTYSAYDETIDLNTWDDGYPSGGNYWSDYTGDDQFSGPEQNNPGSDGIGDTPYTTDDGNNQDNYPLMSPFSERPAMATLIQPSNGATGVSINPTLKVLVTDPNGDTMTVRFYSLTGVLIGTATNVASGSTAQVTWSGRSYSTTYYWYAKVTDSDDHVTKSETWSFTTTTAPSGGETPPPSGPSEIRITVSMTKMNEINNLFGLSLTTPFYARDTDGDGRVDTLVDPNGVLTEVQNTILDGHVIMLISTNKDNKPEFFWDTASNTITPVNYQQGTVQDTIIDKAQETVTVIINIAKTGWVYIDITDQYPPDQYSGFTLTVKTSDGRTIPSNLIWRENGRIYILDDPSTTYHIIYKYTILPPTFNPPTGTTFDSTFTPGSGYEFNIRRPTITITYTEAVTIVVATLNNMDVRHMFTTTDNKVYTFQPTYDLSNGEYTLSITVRDSDGNQLTSTATYKINAPLTTAEEQTQYPWILIAGAIIIILIILFIIGLVLRKGHKPKSLEKKEEPKQMGDNKTKNGNHKNHKK